jgi:hypothetical protein
MLLLCFNELRTVSQRNTTGCLLIAAGVGSKKKRKIEIQTCRAAAASLARTQYRRCSLIPVQLFLAAALASAMNGVNPEPQPTITYTVTIDTTDLSGIDVSMQISGAPRTIRLAMAVHPEYNQRFWRYLRDLRAAVDGKATPVTAESDHSWRISTTDGNAVVRYRIQLPSENQESRAAWHTALRANGA